MMFSVHIWIESVFLELLKIKTF